MDPERWRHVETLYHATLARPAGERAAFLAEACAGDEWLRREVQSLLDQPGSGHGALEGGALAMAAKGFAPSASGGSLIGRRIGPYEVTAHLGAGGMGEVFRAHDTTLGRDVAIKVLPRLFTSDPDRLARFDREARLLASLNHPHIGAIYGVEQSEGGPALILELVEGPTLADRLATGPIPLTEALGIGSADCRCPGCRARARNRPPGPEAGQHQDHARRHREGARLRLGQGRPRATEQRILTLTGRGCWRHARGRDPGHPLVYEPRASSGTGSRQTDRYLGVRLRALRNADRPRRRFPARPHRTRLPRSSSASRTGTRCRPRPRHRSAGCCGVASRRIAHEGSPTLPMFDWKLMTPSAARTLEYLLPHCSSRTRERLAWASGLVLVGLTTAALVAWATRSVSVPPETTRTIVSVAPSNQLLGANPLEQRVGGCAPDPDGGRPLAQWQDARVRRDLGRRINNCTRARWTNSARLRCRARAVAAVPSSRPTGNGSAFGRGANSGRFLSAADRR